MNRHVYTGQVRPITEVPVQKGISRQRKTSEEIASFANLAQGKMRKNAYQTRLERFERGHTVQIDRSLRSSYKAEKRSKLRPRK